MLYNFVQYKGYFFLLSYPVNCLMTPQIYLVIPLVVSPPRLGTTALITVNKIEADGSGSNGIHL